MMELSMNLVVGLNNGTEPCNLELITDELAPEDFVYLVDFIDSDGVPFEEGPENPPNTQGIIVGADTDEPGRLIVTWINGETNSYMPHNLKSVNIS